MPLGKFSELMFRMDSKQHQTFSSPECANEANNIATPKEDCYQYFYLFGDLEPFFCRHLLDPHPVGVDPRILHLGAIDSAISVDLARIGYQNQICVDFSTKVVERMWSRHVAKELGMEWNCLDMRNLNEIPTQSIDVAFDKGTMDAMIESTTREPELGVKHNISQYIREISRVLKDDGTFLCITYTRPRLVQPLFSDSGLWEVQMEKLRGGETVAECFGFALTKKLNGSAG